MFIIYYLFFKAYSHGIFRKFFALIMIANNKKIPNGRLRAGQSPSDLYGSRQFSIAFSQFPRQNIGASLKAFF